MQLLVIQSRSKTTAPQIVWNKLVISVLLLSHICVRFISVTAELTCHQCRGISCLRTSYEATQRCLSDLDFCVNIFEGQSLMAQGCWEQLPEELRNKCDGGTKNTQTTRQLNDCFKCNENLCNKMSSSSFECLQCDSDNNSDCLANPLSLSPSRCAVSRTPNEYCFVKKERERLIRGCSYNLEEQMSCLKSANCFICQPSELYACNNIELEEDDNSSYVDENPEGESDFGSLEQKNQRICHQCIGITCLRNSYEATERCLNNEDICVTVVEDQTVLAQGCWEQLPEEVRSKCNSGSQCLKCNEDFCNNYASETFTCLKCDSNNDDNCRTSPTNLIASRCNVSRTPNAYCFVKQEGERVIRGCSYTLEEQILCLSSDDCMICLPHEIKDCNNIDIVMDTNSGSGNNTEGSEGNLPQDDNSNYGNSNPSTETPIDNNDEGSNSSGNANNNSSTEEPSNDGGEGNIDLENGGSESSSSKNRQVSANTFILINTIIAFLVK